MKPLHLALAVAGFVLLRAIDAGASQLEDYPPHPAGEFGPVWKNRRPPGLPTDARGCSGAGAALPRIEQSAVAEGGTFVRLVSGLARTESGAMIGRPANNFDARPELPANVARGLSLQALSDLGHRNKSSAAQAARLALKAAGQTDASIDALARKVLGYRPFGAPLITAWGAFQWNAPAMRDAGHMAAIGIPGPRFSRDRGWLLSPAEEIDGPVEMYRQIWRWAKERGASDVDAARGVRIWHQSSAAGRRYLERGASSRAWRREWSRVEAKRRAVVDRHLAAVNIT